MRIPVVVVTKDGVPVSDLKASEFRLFEDGRPRRIELFLRNADAGPNPPPELDLSVAVLLDTSTSMLTVLQRARRTITDFMTSLAGARLRIILSFGPDIERWRFDPAHPEAVFAEILSRGGGRTPLYGALAEALHDLRQEPGRHAIVLLTDGEEQGSTISRTELIAALKASHDVVYALSFAGHLASDGKHDRAVAAEAALRQLARVSGGAVFDGFDQKAGAYFERIRAELESQYVLGFLPGDRRPGFRRLRVEVTRPNLRVRHREGYLRRGN